MATLNAKPKDYEVELCRKCLFKNCRPTHSLCLIQIERRGDKMIDKETLALLDQCVLAKEKDTETRDAIRNEIRRVRSMKKATKESINIRKADIEIKRLKELEKQYQKKIMAFTMKKLAEKLDISENLVTSLARRSFYNDEKGQNIEG